MDYEKAYKDALERARKLYRGAVILQLEQDIKDYEEIFPELADSEDEKIRKKLICFVENWKNRDYNSSFDDFPIFTSNSDECDRILAWLEKQGEKPQGKSALEAIKKEKVDNANKVESKFKVGDWIVRSAEGFKHNTYLITEVKDYYVCEDLKGRRVTFTFNDVHKNFKLWDISDAKDGDVLVYHNNLTEIIMLFKSWVAEREAAYTHFHIFDNNYRVDGSCDCGYGAHPATKEQRNLLFAKIKRVGYEWNAYKKKLLKEEEVSSTHALIQKACEWLKDNYPYYFETDIEQEFKKAQKGG